MAKITNLDLKKYEKMYDSFDLGHKSDHYISVRKMAVNLAKKYAPDKVELAYIAATIHDIGISVNREDHELEGEKLIRQDIYLSSRLSKNDFDEICHAVREHRASNGKPKTILAKIISDADRGGCCENSAVAFCRSYFYQLNKYPNHSEEELILESAKHQAEKFSPGSYGRRTYFSKTEKRLKKIYSPIIKAYNKKDFEYFKTLIKSLLK